VFADARMRQIGLSILKRFNFISSKNGKGNQSLPAYALSGAELHCQEEHCRRTAEAKT
jgi:hypothetical protein